MTQLTGNHLVQMRQQHLARKDQIEDQIEDLIGELNQHKGAVAALDQILLLGKQLAEDVNPATDPNAESDQ